ncbi:MAG TPA: hypothetical protein VID72_02600 [Ktedonobacterales bacterium]
MERLYKAAAWVAGVATVLGLAFAIMISAQALSYYAQVPQVFVNDGLYTALVSSLNVSDVASNIRPIALLLASGVTLLAIALAWADRRWGWLSALIVVTILALLWPAAVEAWAFTSIHSLPPVPVTPAMEIMTFSAYVAPLIPVVLALILALIRRKAAPSAPTDAPLDTVRSPQ